MGMEISLVQLHSYNIGEPIFFSTSELVWEMACLQVAINV